MTIFCTKRDSNSKPLNYEATSVTVRLSDLHSKKGKVRLPYVKHALNVRYKTYVKRMDRAPYV